LLNPFKEQPHLPAYLTGISNNFSREFEIKTTRRASGMMNALGWGIAKLSPASSAHDAFLLAPGS